MRQIFSTRLKWVGTKLCSDVAKVPCNMCSNLFIVNNL